MSEVRIWKKKKEIDTFSAALAIGYMVFGALEALGGVGYEGEWLADLYVQAA